MASKVALILGESGSGKTTAIETLDPKTTFIINCVGKPLPFKGSDKLYTIWSKEGNPKGNMCITRSPSVILTWLEAINKSMPHIKTIVLDDQQYVMSLEFLDRAKEIGFTKFSELAQNLVNIINKSKELRDDLIVLHLCHNDTDEGIKSMKTVGKLVKEKITPEGLYTMVLGAEKMMREDKLSYVFITNAVTPQDIYKTPKGMFDQLYIPNDYKLLCDTINQYYS